MKPSTAERCPICAKRSTSAYLPFCSSKCAYVDLGHWFAASYVIAGTPEDEDQMKNIHNEDELFEE